MTYDLTQYDDLVAALLSKMTLEEKIGQLAQFNAGDATGPDNVKVDQSELATRGGVGSVLNLTGAAAVNALQRQAIEQSRLGIPILLGLDVIHGYRTIYPIPLGLSASWNARLIEQCARMAAVEGTSEGLNWTFSPMVDIARDARWGRISEGSGEDPHLAQILAKAWVDGYQGDSLSGSTSLAACAKHFAGYGSVEGGREYELGDLSDRSLRDVYLPPFKATVDAGVATIMSAFNTIQGVPASANDRLLTTILRDEWGFNGLVVSDWNSIGELIDHGVALDGAEAARKALNAGVDMDMCANLYITKIAELVQTGTVSEQSVDRAVKRVLRVKFALGLFDKPYTDELSSKAVILSPDHLALARRAAEESVVLLKNDRFSGKPVLPLSDALFVALIGPLAKSKYDMLGSWPAKGEPDDAVTLFESLSDMLGDQLIYADGGSVKESSEVDIADAVNVASLADIVVIALGETRDMSGEAAARTDLGLPGNQLELLQAVVATGKPVVLILFNGRPLALPWASEHVPAILEAWFPGVQAGPALTRVLYGVVNPSGKLTASFPRSVGQMPLYYNRFNTGRPPNEAEPGSGYIGGYLDERITPIFPFGWGLSYTEFEYSPTKILTPTISVDDLKHGGSITVEGTIRNVGTRPGIEIVQLYIRQRGTSVARPIRELKGFDRIELLPGESQTVQFELTAQDLAFWNIDLTESVEPAELTVWIAPHSTGGIPDKIMIERGI